MKCTGAGERSLADFCLPGMHKAPGLPLITAGNKMWWHIPGIPALRRLEAGGAIQGYPWVHTKFEASLDYNRTVSLNE